MPRFARRFLTSTFVVYRLQVPIFVGISRSRLQRYCETVGCIGGASTVFLRRVKIPIRQIAAGSIHYLNGRGTFYVNLGVVKRHALHPASARIFQLDRQVFGGNATAGMHAHCGDLAVAFGEEMCLHFRRLLRRHTM